MNISANGLDGIVVADTLLSDVDGERGRLVIAGRDVEALAFDTPFEALCARLWSQPLAAVTRALGDARVAAFERLSRLGDALDSSDGMDALRASIAHLPGSLDDAAMIAGAAAVFSAAWARRREGRAAIAPDAGRSHADDYLRAVKVEAFIPWSLTVTRYASIAARSARVGASPRTMRR